jgi:hypothetical protein
MIAYWIIEGRNGQVFFDSAETCRGLDRILSLQQFGLTRSFERFPVFPDDADFLSTETGKPCRLSQKSIFVAWAFRSKSVL